MQEARPILPKLLIMAILLAALCLILLLSGMGLLVMLISVSGFLLWWFTRREPPEGEMPCASVSCCHYLDDREEEKQKR
jgi:hypothetical protein